MKITEVAEAVGLTQKAIRLYEEKGLLSVSRMENGYRDYSVDDVERLKVLKLLRTAGVALSDIKLYLFGICSLSEIIDKRKAEITRENGKNSEQYSHCEKIEKQILCGSADIESSEIFSEKEKISDEPQGALSVGIDIGTTTISAVVMDIDNKRQIDAYTLFHNADLTASPGFKEQQAEAILDKAVKLLKHIRSSYKGITGIGITGQMHGILYYNEEGRPISNLINWQDKRADLPSFDKKSAVQLIKEITGETIHTGYGIASHFYNERFGLVPSSAVGFCSIMDALAMKLCGLKKAFTHSSIAASFGLFDLKNDSFKDDLLTSLYINKDFTPEVTKDSVVIGQWDGIPVAVPIGDNQAAFLGSVHDHRRELLVNIGTGSQISVATDYKEEFGSGIELRPLIEGKYIASGSSLCGGSAYAMLECFFRSYAEALGHRDMPQYDIMNLLAERAYSSGQTPPTVETSFKGTRTEPNKRGSFGMISEDNFTPEAFILGVLSGMCRELHDLYCKVGIKKTQVIASGGAVRKNAVLRHLIEDIFALPMTVSYVKEEAATGAALFAALCSKRIGYSDGFGDYLV